MPYRLTFKNTLLLIIRYLSIFPISLIYILILKFYTMPNHTTHHTHFWVYPHPLLTTVKLHTREHLYSHTRIHAHEGTTSNSLRDKYLNFGFQYELNMIIPSPPRARTFVPIPPQATDFVAVTNTLREDVENSCCKVVICSELQHSLSIPTYALCSLPCRLKKCFCGVIV